MTNVNRKKEKMLYLSPPGRCHCAVF